MTEILSETGGTVWQVKVEVGQTVQSGDVVVVLESMKIEIPVVAPSDGVVVELRVEPNATVVEGDVLAVIEPSS